MQTELIKQLNQVLKAFPEYWDNEKLQRTKVINDIKERKPDLIKALINNAKIKSLYSTEIDGVLVFDFHALTNLLQYKEYWADSFTKYRNSVGLTSEGKYLNYNSDVVLDFPFKDCVLEAGMTREEQGKDEVYYNEIIACDEIDKLFSPKVLTNVKRYSKDGVEENIIDFSNEDNLIIKGNNLIALHSLKERYAGKVKLIYIDPPYNTGNDGFKYNDRFNHSTWLTFMKNRLEVARELLSDDGFICCHIDDSENHYLKILMDTIFNIDNYLNTLYVQVRYANKTLKQDMNFHKQVEQIHVYQKSKKSIPNLDKKTKDIDKYIYYVEEFNEGKEIILGNKKVIIFDKSSYRIIKKEASEDGLKEIWATGSILDGNSSGRFFRDYLHGRYNIDGLGVLYKVYEIGDDKFDYRYFTGPQKEGATKGKYYQGVPISQLNSDQAIHTSPIENFYDFASNFGNCRHEGGIEFRSGKKPEILLNTLIKYFSNKNDLVLDFHLGSGTTCAVAQKMERRFIGIEQMDYINEISIPRLVNTVNGDNTGISKITNWQGGGSFVYAELKELNYTYIHEIQSAKSYDDLTKLFEVMKQTAHLNYQIELDKILNDAYEVDSIGELVTFEDLTLDEQKQLLIELLDKNHLYVNADDMNDANLNVSEQDKAFTHSFYGKGE